MAGHAAACFGAIKTERIVLPTTEAMETNADANEAAMFGVSLFNSEEAQLKEEMNEEARVCLSLQPFTRIDRNARWRSSCSRGTRSAPTSRRVTSARRR